MRRVCERRAPCGDGRPAVNGRAAESDAAPCEHDKLGCGWREPHDAHTKVGDGRPCCGWPPQCSPAEKPAVGDLYRWSGDPSLTIEVIKVGRKNATIRVGSVPGSGWIKPQPMPFPDSFTRVFPPAATTQPSEPRA